MEKEDTVVLTIFVKAKQHELIGMSSGRKGFGTKFAGAWADQV
eukprot:SAG31_NODE_6029_length_2202_cov_1.383738_2_plen_43_part_00